MTDPRSDENIRRHAGSRGWSSNSAGRIIRVPRPQRSGKPPRSDAAVDQTDSARIVGGYGVEREAEKAKAQLAFGADFRFLRQVTQAILRSSGTYSGWRRRRSPHDGRLSKSSIRRLLYEKGTSKTARDSGVIACVLLQTENSRDASRCRPGPTKRGLEGGFKAAFGAGMTTSLDQTRRGERSRIGRHHPKAANSTWHYRAAPSAGAGDRWRKLVFLSRSMPRMVGRDHLATSHLIEARTEMQKAAAHSDAAHEVVGLLFFRAVALRKLAAFPASWQPL